MRFERCSTQGLPLKPWLVIAYLVTAAYRSTVGGSAMFTGGGMSRPLGLSVATRPTTSLVKIYCIHIVEGNHVSGIPL